jgi:hypothetical protein
MKIDNFANEIAAGMDRALNSDENKKLFSKASVIEKLAFHRVSDEDKLVSETEESLKTILDINKTAAEKENCSGCECGEEKGSECKCHCHEDSPTKSASVEDIVGDLLAVSEALEDAGFEKLAADSAILAGSLIAQAKAKKDSKDSKKSPKMGIKERMEKMRKMKGGKGGKSKDSKDSKKSPSKSSKPASKSSKPATKSSK